LQNVKRLVYSLKRRFGTEMNFYRENDSQPDTESGVIFQDRKKYHIENGVFLEQTAIDYGSLIKVLGQLSGTMEVVNAIILLDGSDFNDEFMPHQKDYVIIKHQRYEIKSVKEVDDFESLLINLVEYKGSETFEIHDRSVKDKLNLVQVLKVVKNHIYLENIVDELSFNETLETAGMGRKLLGIFPIEFFPIRLFPPHLFPSNTLNVINIYLSDVLDIQDGVEYNQQYVYTRLEIIENQMEFVETISTNFFIISIHDDMKLVENMVLVIPPILS
jgi:hypothetical protein